MLFWVPAARFISMRQMPILTTAQLIIILHEGAADCIGQQPIRGFSVAQSVATLLPVIVMAHLLGGLATLSLLLWMWLQSRSAHVYSPGPQLRAMRRWVVLGLSILVAQIALGGWTSANYSALACPDLPTCMNQWWPDTNFGEGFVLWREIGVNYEGGTLDQASRTAIHMAHRIGAVITLFVLLFVSFKLIRVATFQRIGALLMTLILVQFLLGVLNVALQLPLANAVAHNGGAALLLVILISLLYRTSPGKF